MPRIEREWKKAVLLLLAVPMVLGTGCSSSDDDDGGEPIATSYFGSFTTDAGLAGTFSMAEIAASPARSTFDLFRGTEGDVAGTLSASTGETASFSGTADSEEGFLSLSGTGGLFLSGFVDGPVAGGTISGSPFQSGTFVGLSGSSTSVSVFCGEFFDNSNPSVAAGRFSLTVSGGRALATVSSVGEGSTFLTNGSTSGSGVTVSSFAPDVTLQASGTISGGNASGTWSEDANGGMWAGSTASCGAR